MSGQGGHEIDHVAPNQGLAARETKPPDAKVNEGGAESVELLKGQNLGPGQEAHVLGHAIAAAKVAPIGHRDPHIADEPTKRVGQRGFRQVIGLRDVERFHIRP
jgi:hypothetical protein